MATALAAALSVTPLLANESEPGRRLGEAAIVLSRIMESPERAIPEELLARAHCVVIVADLQVGAFVVTGKVGKGFVVCRSTPHGSWSGPAALRIEAGRIGFHIGGSTADLVMLVMNANGADHVLNSKLHARGGGLGCGWTGGSDAAGADRRPGASRRADVVPFERRAERRGARGRNAPPGSRRQ